MTFFQGPDQREPGDGLPLPLEAHRAGGELQPGPMLKTFYRPAFTSL